jgi:hypothetical protein
MAATVATMTLLRLLENIVWLLSVRLLISGIAGRAGNAVEKARKVAARLCGAR